MWFLYWSYMIWLVGKGTYILINIDVICDHMWSYFKVSLVVILKHSQKLKQEVWHEYNSIWNWTGYSWLAPLCKFRLPSTKRYFLYSSFQISAAVSFCGSEVLPSRICGGTILECLLNPYSFTNLPKPLPHLKKILSFASLTALSLSLVKWCKLPKWSSGARSPYFRLTLSHNQPIR